LAAVLTVSEELVNWREHTSQHYDKQMNLTNNMSATVLESLLTKTDARKTIKRSRQDTTPVAAQLCQHNMAKPLTTEIKPDADADIHTRLRTQLMHRLAGHWCRRTSVGRRHRSNASSTAAAGAEDKNWKMFDMSLPLSGQLEKLDPGPLHSVDCHCITHPSTQYLSTRSWTCRVESLSDSTAIISVSPAVLSLSCSMHVRHHNIHQNYSRPGQHHPTSFFSGGTSCLIPHTSSFVQCLIQSVFASVHPEVQTISTYPS